ncbi:MAG: DUF4395 domain-containing protein [Dehalococcoidia bacterium]
MITQSTQTTVTGIFTFPHPVNDVAARMVAGMVVLLSLATILFQAPWLLFFLAYGFLARVATGPTLSLMGLLATRVLVPLIGNPERLVAGPPKRFAQTIGLVFSTTSLLLYYGFGLSVAAYGVLGVLALFAALEAILGFCMGCFVFGILMRVGVVPQETCEKCNNLSLGQPQSPSA